MLEITGDTWDYINLRDSVCYQNLYWCQWSNGLPSETMLYMKYVMRAVPFLMSRIHSAIRENVSVHGLTWFLKLYQCYWYLLEENTMVYHRSLRALGHQQQWWCSLFLLRSYLPQKTIVMSVMYGYSPSVEHGMYKILTITRITIDTNGQTLQIPVSITIFMLRIHTATRDDVPVHDLTFQLNYGVNDNSVLINFLVYSWSMLPKKKVGF